MAAELAVLTSLFVTNRDGSMTTANGSFREARLVDVWLVIALTGGACLVRAVGLLSERLWYDELLSVNFSNHGIVETFLTVARFDVHPPLYYLQLCVWMLFGTSDEIVMANSITWSVLTVAMVYFVGRFLADRCAGDIAAGLVAVSPAVVFFSHQVRMYSFVSFLLVGAFFFMLRFLKSNRRRNLVAASLLICAAAYSHAAGILMGTGVAAYGAVRAIQGRNSRQLMSMIVAGVLVALICLPAIGFVANRGINHATAPDLAELALSARFLLIGTSNAVAAIDGRVLGTLAAGLMLFVLSSRESRWLFLSTVVVPIVVIYLVSHLVTPIWLDRTVVFVVPFIAISLGVRFAALMEAPWSNARALASTAVVAALMVISLFATVGQQASHGKGDAYLPMATYVSDLARPGDIVLLDMPAYSAWGFLWYFAGPGWGGPLAFHDVNPTWRRLLDRIGADWSRRLGWVPSARDYDVRGVTVTATFIDPPPTVAPAPRLIVVVQGLGQDRSDSRGDRRLVSSERFENFTVERWSRE